VKDLLLDMDGALGEVLLGDHLAAQRMHGMKQPHGEGRAGAQA
jgi:hypothetical protein